MVSIAFQGLSAPQATAANTLPLGIALESHPYPYSVQYLPLEIEGQSLRMAYMDVPATGASNGATLVLMHGKNFPSSYWQVPIQKLTAAGYRVIVPDQIGFVNKSSKPDCNRSEGVRTCIRKLEQSLLL